MKATRLPISREIVIIYGTLGITSGDSAPHSTSSLHPLIRNHRPLEHTAFISSTLHYHTTRLRQRLASPPADEYAPDEEPSPVPEFHCRFLAVVAQRVAERVTHGEPTWKFYAFSK